MSIAAKLYYKLPMRVKRSCSYLRLFKLYRTANRYRITEVNGVKFNVDLYTYVGNSLYNLGVYEKKTSKIIEHYVKPGDTVIDVGASIGAHALRLAKKVGPKGHVYTFEPSIYLYDEFQKNMELNSFKNITAENMGLSDKDEEGTIQMERLGRLDGGKLDQPIKMTEFTSLDNYVKKHSIKNIKFIKIDTDGAEVEIIKGATKTLKRDHPIIVIEVRQETANKLYDLLTEIEYTFELDFQILSREEVYHKSTHVENVLCRCR